MDIRAYLMILWRRKWIIAVTLVVTVAVALIRTMMDTPTYTTAATLRVSTLSVGSLDYLQYDLSYTDRLMNTYARIATSGPVIDELMTRLDLDTPPDVSIDLVQGTELMRVVVTDEDPQLASDAADTLAALLIEQFTAGTSTTQAATEILLEQLNEAQANLEDARSAYESLASRYDPDNEDVQAAERLVTTRERTYSLLLDQYERARTSELVRANQLSIVEYARVPRSPSSPNMFLNLVFGVVLGGLVGLALAFTVESLDTTLYTSHEIQHVAEQPVLGRIPVLGGRAARNVWDDLPAVALESFRSLRTKLFLIRDDVPLRTLLVTSAEAGDGKTTIVAHLAVSLARAGHNVVVLDADLRRPRLHEMFQIENKVGLADVLQGEAELNDVLDRNAELDLCVIPSGPTPADPPELLRSPLMASLLSQLAEEFDIVLLDTPAMQPVVDTAVLASVVDGVALVVRRSRSHKGSLLNAAEQLTENAADVLGLIINESEPGGHYYYTAS
ncbi:MAG: polysaccharide biosynthesis tyrosine autokinase [Anaerolineae bacterium]|nr:polysaccharide biosynthesis tyrosine autokinase [Anaerolineae bacterium]